MDDLNNLFDNIIINNNIFTTINQEIELLKTYILNSIIIFDFNSSIIIRTSGPSGIIFIIIKISLKFYFQFLIYSL
jgi:hypothetical protein